MNLNKIYETEAVKIYETDHAGEYKVEAGNLFWFTDSEGNGSMPECLRGTFIETEVLSYLQKIELSQ